MTGRSGADGPGVAVRPSAERISRLLDGFAELSETAPADGVTRLAYTPMERRAHERFGAHMAGLGLRVWTDAAGNTYAERPGSGDGPAIGTGSHLDSVVRAGRFDGIVGVVAAMEVATILDQSSDTHHHPIRFVAFAGEEGARFGQACIGSKAAAGRWTTDGLRQLRDAEGVTLHAAMTALGLSPDTIRDAAWNAAEWAAWLELHVEQGQVLESRDRRLGIVDLISGSTRFELVLEGYASHTGSTPMNLRADALVAAAEVVLLCEEIATDARHHGTRVTVGKLDVFPGAVTTIPGQVSMFVDVRDIDAGRQRDTADEIVRRARAMVARRGVSLSARLVSDESPVVLPTWIRTVTGQVCRDMGVAYRTMFSGASHDTQMVASVVPAGMIFVPSRGGLSHVPEEWTSAADVALGVEALARSLLELDRHLLEMER